MNNNIPQNTDLKEGPIEEPEDHLPETSLGDLPETMQQAVSSAGWHSLMPVQAKAIPYILDGRDLIVQSRTGSGKTGAFILPILHRIDPNKPHCQALILVPTRELAQQVTREAELLSGESGIRTIAVYGGTSYGPQLDAFKKGAHIVIGTPGRILDHLLKKSLLLDDLDILVFDEADRMLSMGFYPDMKQIQRYLPHTDINGYMFSATYPPRVISLANQFLRRPDMLSLSRDNVHVLETAHDFYVVPPMKKDRCLVRIIEVENPDSAIIFCNMKSTVHYVSVVLKRFGYDADELTSDLPQKARERILNRVRNGSLKFLVATDIAARGIDIPELSHVIQYEPPEDLEAYIHRAGRTGRAGATGESITLVNRLEKMNLMGISRRFKIEMLERELPEDEDVQSIVSQRATVLLEAQLRDLSPAEQERIQPFMSLAKELSGKESEQPVLAMLLDEYYQRSLHAAAETREQNEHPESEAPKETLPGETEVQAAVLQKTTDLLEAKLRKLDRVEQERIQRFIPLGKSLSESEDELPVIAMLLEAYHQKSLQDATREKKKKSRSKRRSKSRNNSRRRRKRQQDNT
jgi:ATP-dependent RNA helicase DeaD